MSIKNLPICLLVAFMAPMALSYSQTRQDRLTEHVYYFASDSLHGRAAGSEDAAKAAAYIVDEFESIGLKPLYDDWYMPFTTKGTNYKNVVAVLEGNDPALKDQYIVLGAHYDHLGIKKGEIYNGADDNASGTAAVIEIARALYPQRESLKRSVVIAAFDAEELGLYGSTALAHRMIDEDSLDVRLMMSIDMVGWYKATGQLSMMGVATIRNGKKVLESDKINLKFTRFEWSPVTATDTEGFAKRHVPTLAVSTGLKSPYHKPEDDADLIDYEGLDKVTDYLTDLTLSVASDENFSSSGRVARKHLGKMPTLEVGVSLASGRSHFEFPKAAFDGKSGYTYGAGLTAQLSFGSSRRLGLRVEPTFLRTSARYPDDSGIYSSAVKYKGNELLVPAQLIFQRNDGAFYFGVGGYYDRRFKTSLPVDYTIRTDDYGVSSVLGLRSGKIGLEAMWLWSTVPFFNAESAPSVRQGTRLVKFCKYF